MDSRNMVVASNICIFLGFLLFSCVTATVSYDDRAIYHCQWAMEDSYLWIHSLPTKPSRDLIQKAKDGGLDVIETYVFWNGHEPSPGQYYIEERYDLVQFIKLVRQAGLYVRLYVHLRIGPYVCAEWNFGGMEGVGASNMAVVINQPAFKELNRKVISKSSSNIEPNGEETLVSLMILQCMLIWLEGTMMQETRESVKFGFPMAFTTTMLSWSVLEIGGLMKGELQNARGAIRWATDYLLKATAHPGTIYVQFLPCLIRGVLMEVQRLVMQAKTIPARKGQKKWTQQEQFQKSTKKLPELILLLTAAAALASAFFVFRKCDPYYSKTTYEEACLNDKDVGDKKEWLKEGMNCDMILEISFARTTIEQD